MHTFAEFRATPPLHRSPSPLLHPTQGWKASTALPRVIDGGVRGVKGPSIKGQEVVPGDLAEAGLKRLKGLCYAPT